MPLNYVNSIPLHIQLQKNIEQNILDGVYQEKIPSEKDLMEEFYVSRSTVRQAVSQLVKEGMLEKRPGKGTFIVIKPVSDWLGNLSTTSEIIERMGMEPSIKLMKAEILTLDHKMRNLTGLEQAYHFVRIRYANHTPIGIERHYYPVELGRKLVDYDLNKESFYNLLERELGIKALEAEQNIKAGIPSKADAEILKIDANASILHTERLITDSREEFIELEHANYRADMYSFKIKLSRKS